MSFHSGKTSRRSSTTLRLLVSTTFVAVLVALLPSPAAADAPVVYLADLRPGRFAFTPVGEKVIFAESDEATGAEPWCADASTGTAWMLADLMPGPAGSDPIAFASAGDVAYFYSDDPEGGYGYVMWRTDCSAENTIKLAALAPYYDYFYTSAPATAVRWAEDGLLFTAYDEPHGYELWITDGTPAGTRILMDIDPGQESSYPTGYLAGGGRVYFLADDGTHGEEVWVTDGTQAGTHLLRDVLLGASSSYSLGLTAFGGSLYFGAYSGGVTLDLWKSDGTTDGTQIVAPLLDISEAWYWSSGRFWMEDVGSALYVYYLDPLQGVRLWKSDGTGAGTFRLDLLSSGDGRVVEWQADRPDDVLYYPGHSAETGTELWRTDGTVAGTWLVKDMNPGAANSTPDHLTRVGSRGLIFYSAATDETGVELWVTEGTEASTRLHADIVPGEGSSNPRAFVATGHFLYFLTGSSASSCQLRATRLEPPADGPTVYLPVVLS